MIEHKDMERLTEGDLKYINKKHRCPVCRSKNGALLAGPSGGASINSKCANPDCGQEYCLGMGFNEIWTGEYLSRKDPGLYGGLLFDPIDDDVPPRNFWPKLTEQTVIITLAILVLILAIMLFVYR
jgi:hypothetical protein